MQQPVTAARSHEPAMRAGLGGAAKEGGPGVPAGRHGPGEMRGGKSGCAAAPAGLALASGRG